jgi:hypothetical protein
VTAPCGTRAAESRHRYAGNWPCHTCLDVRRDVLEWAHNPSRVAPWAHLTGQHAAHLTFGAFTPDERMHIAYEVFRTGAPLPKFAHILGLPADDAQALHRGFTALEAARADGPAKTAA